MDIIQDNLSLIFADLSISSDYDKNSKSYKRLLLTLNKINLCLFNILEFPDQFKTSDMFWNNLTLQSNVYKLKAYLYDPKMDYIVCEYEDHIIKIFNGTHILLPYPLDSCFKRS